MEEIDQQFLIEDICSRLLYGVYVKFKQHNEPLRLSVKDCLAIINGGEQIDDIQHLYLRSMSSMTQEECRELRWIIATEPLWAMFDFFYSHHIDFRDLIPMGLAIEAKEGMYKTE